MLFWTNRKYCERRVEPPPRGILHQKMTEMMRCAAYKFGVTTKRSAKPIGRLGLSELTQLIDADTANSPCIELAECHHLAWCLARICAVRPGSLAQPSLLAARRRKPYQYPTWNSMNITRGDHPGQFNLVAEFVSVKGNNEMDAAAKDKTLTFTIQSPKQPRNLIFSPSHRLLVMAIRRGAIEGIDSIEELLSSDNVNIVWKAEFRKKPIFLAGGPRGLSVLEDEAATDHSLTDYLRQRARRMLGYPLDITYYSFRKESAMNLVRAFGPDVTRELMGHDAETKTLETYYLARTPVMDVSAVVFDEPDSGAQIRADKRLALEVLSPEILARLKGAALDALCRKIAAEDPNYPLHRSAEDEKRYDRRIRKAAMRQLIADAHEARRVSETVTDRENTRARLDKASEFAKSMARQARENMKSTRDEEQIGEDDDDLDEEHEEWNGLAEDDAEDRGDENEVFVQVPFEDDGEDDDIDKIPYLEAVRAMMHILYENSFSQHQVMNKQRLLCPLCLDDPTIPEEDKKKEWRKDHIDRHMLSNIHSKHAEYMRQMEIDARNHPDGLYVCNVCQKVLPAGTPLPSFDGRFALKSLVRHMTTSNDRKIQGISSKEDWSAAAAKAHDDIKTAMGFYEPDFKGDLEHKKKVATYFRETRLRGSKIQWSKIVELKASQPHESLPGWQYGVPDEDDDKFFEGLTTNPPDDDELLKGLTADPQFEMYTQDIIEAGKGSLIAMDLDQLWNMEE